MFLNLYFHKSSTFAAPINYFKRSKSLFIHSKTRKSTFKIVGNILRMNKLYSKKTNINQKIINPKNRLNINLKLI